jgi:TonB family protein
MATKVSEQTERSRVRGGTSDELGVVAQNARAFTNASGAVIALSEGNAAEIICRARAGSSAPEVGTALRVERTFIGLCIQSGKELRCDDAETDPRVDTAAIRALGIRSMVVVPIKQEGRVVGVLAAFAPTAHAFTITHVAVLKTMAGKIPAYLQRTHRKQAYSREPLPAPPAKAVAVSPAATPAPPPAVVIKPVEPALAHRRLAVVPKVEPVRAGTLAEEIDPARFSQKPARFSQKPDRFSQKKDTNRHDEQKESKTDFRPMFDTFNAVAAPEKRLGANVLMLGGVAVLIIAVAVEFSLILRKPAGVPQPALETLSSPGTPAAPAPASAPAKNALASPPAKFDETQPKREEVRPKREETVRLSEGPSRISRATDNSAPTSEAPAIFLGYLPDSGSLSNLVIPGSQLPNPRLLRQSAFEPVTALKKVPPVYPLVAKQNKLTGSVVVQGTVDKNGRIGDLRLISGSPLFRDAAFAAVKQWVFKPARLNGQAIEQPAIIRLYFREKGRPEVFF